MKQKFREMQDRMQSPASEKNDFRGTQNPGSKTTSKTPREDYIDFEEVK